MHRSTFRKFCPERYAAHIVLSRQSVKLCICALPQVRHDGSGTNPKWHLFSVEVDDLQTGDRWFFRGDRWFSVASGLWHRLSATLQDPRTALQVRPTGVSLPRTPRFLPSHFHSECRCAHTLRHVSTPLPQTVLPAIRCPASQDYEIVVRTSDIKV